MNYILTSHAKKRMVERNISFDSIKKAIELPDYTIKKDGKIEVYKNMDKENLKVVYVEEDNYIKVITVIIK